MMSEQRQTQRPALSAQHSFLGLILAAYVALAAGYALATPRWNNPDEPAHFNYVRDVAERGRLPIIQHGDWDADLLERQKAARFPDDSSIKTIRYEGHQPPLYYLLASPVYMTAGPLGLGGQVLALRGLSILLGAVVVVAAFLAGREAFPERPAIALLAAATVAFIPMHTAMSAAINNDSLANALAGLTVAALLGGLRRGFDDHLAVGLGLLLGALLLTKLTVYFYVPLALGALALSGLRRLPPDSPGSWGTIGRRPLLALAAAVAVSSWWFVRNAQVYGWTDLLAAARHDEVVLGQPRWDRLDAAAGDYLVRVLFRSFWGQFGWMGVVLEDRLYLLYLALTLLGVLGLALVVRDRLGSRASNGKRELDPRDEPSCESAGRRLQMGVLVGAIVLVVAQVALYNVRFIQPQGRYLFPALVPLALLLSLGWSRLAARATAGRRFGAWPAATLGAGATWAMLDGVGPLLVGRFWPARFLVLPAGATALGLTLAPRVTAAVSDRGLLVGLGLGLVLLDLVCLLRFVAPAFR
jgi:4-amino-4-deoxy-L-arabinose transferase-like glycosyltransferase